MNKNNQTSLGLKQSLQEAGSPEERKAIVDGLPYETGFGKPPKATQFKKGASPNPRGRPKGSKNLATVVRDEGNQPVEVVENGRRRKLTKLEIFVRQIFNKASGGDLKACALIVETMRKTNQLEDLPAQTALAFDERDFLAAIELAQLFNQTPDGE
jgi:hypothetical protein